MFDTTITLFNRYKSRKTGDKWFKTVINNVNVIIDKAAIVATQGANTSDSVKLLVNYDTDTAGNIIIGNKIYLAPKKWEEVLTDDLDKYVTFKSGSNFDFVLVGQLDEDISLNDEDYTEGLYNYLNKSYDNVFSISSVGEYKLIPHFEIMAK